MPLYKPKIPVCVAIGCSGVALAFQLVAVAGTGWLIFSNQFSSIEEGLFRVCDRSRDICSAYDSVNDWAKACQAFSILTLLAIFGSFVLGVLHIFREDTQRLTLPAVGLGVASAVYVAVEVGVFVGETKELITSATASYGYGLYLSVVAGVLSGMTAILHVVGRVIIR